MPPKRKAAARLSGLAGSDDEDVMQVNEAQELRPAKKPRGRPRSKATENKTLVKAKKDSLAPPQAVEPTTKRNARRGRPKGVSSSVHAAETQETKEQERDEVEEGDTASQLAENAPVSHNERDTPKQASKAKKAAKPAETAGTRGRKKVSMEKKVQTDGEFEYTPTAVRQIKSPEKLKEQIEQPEQLKRQQRRAQPEADKGNEVPEGEKDVPDVVVETMLQDGPEQSRSGSASPAKRRQSSQRNLPSSPLKRRSGGSGEDKKGGGEPELRRRIGDLTKQNDALENRYRILKEIGIVEANANMEKLRKQCESMKTASDNVIASLKEELAAQKALGQQSRALQRQLRERDDEISRLKSQAEEASSQVSATQNEVKALKTKLAAARNTAASLENAAIKMPGSAIKGGGAANRANAAANAEAAHAAQFAQLKEDLYSDLTGLIIRDVKKRENDHLYDCIQTGINGSE
ncbi:hypothetical protein EYZ11_001316 [Aspergillus tanneri]|uniref:Monopolin complex subunit Csm1/Pcs1 C-terminal domain-containing protein n=1 Tax=Aspergillus tanneri TaxID=1220188 RepID=A0A4S3JUZ0_9EURO|nr:hypothetical protein EYZ11_001316 [Aspergillus tanneri]